MKSTQSPARDELLRLLKMDVFSILHDQGYLGTKAIRKRKKGRWMDWFLFQKQVGRDFYVVEIDVKSFSRPTFEIYGGKVPPEGITHWFPSLHSEAHLEPENVTAGDLEVQHHLQAYGQHAGRSNFCPALLSWWLQGPRCVAKIVNDASNRLPALLNFIEHGIPSLAVWSYLNLPDPTRIPEPITEKQANDYWRHVEELNRLNSRAERAPAKPGK